MKVDKNTEYYIENSDDLVKLIQDILENQEKYQKINLTMWLFDAYRRQDEN